MSNQTQGVGVHPETARRAYEAEHPRVREVIARAPWNLDVRNWMRGLPVAVEDRRRALIARILTEIGQAARDTYGSDHPQAAASDAPVPPEWERSARRRVTPRRGRRA